MKLDLVRLNLISRTLIWLPGPNGFPFLLLLWLRRVKCIQLSCNSPLVFLLHDLFKLRCFLWNLTLSQYLKTARWIIESPVFCCNLGERFLWNGCSPISMGTIDHESRQSLVKLSHWLSGQTRRHVHSVSWLFDMAQAFEVLATRSANVSSFVRLNFFNLFSVDLEGKVYTLIKQWLLSVAQFGVSRDWNAFKRGLANLKFELPHLIFIQRVIFHGF